MEKNSKFTNVHSGHRKRVKANVVENGFSQLEDHRLLELLLFYSIPQADTNGLAHELLNEFGSLKEVFSADINRLMKVNGVGENTAILLSAMGETYIRLIKSSSKKKNAFYKSVESYKELAKSVLIGEKNEKVVVFCFDSLHRLKKSVVVSEGTENSSYIDVRKAVQAAMDANAVKVVIAHNHPASTCSPSANDIDSTRSICVLFRKLNMVLCDHIIIGEDGEAYSMYSDSMFTQMFY